MKNLTILVSGSAIAQLIGIAASPLLSRLYSPESFGVVGLVISIVGVLSVVGSLKYEMALVVERDDHRARVIQRLCWSLLLFTTALVALVSISAPFWWHYLGISQMLKTYLPWVLPIFFFTGLFNIYDFRLNREREYRSLSLAGVARRLSLVVTQIVLGFCGAQAAGLLVGNLVGCLIAVLVLFLTNRNLLSFERCERTETRSIAKEHYRFPAYSAPQNLINSLSQNLPVYLLGYFYGMETVGAYWFAMRLLQLPAALVGQSIRQVFYKEAVDLVANLVGLRRLYTKLTLLLALFIVLPIVSMFIWGVDLFVFCFGEEWMQAGEFSSWMFLWIGIGFINPPSVVLFNVFNKQKLFAGYDIVLLITRVTALIVGGVKYSVIQTVAMYSLVGAVFNILLILYWFYYLKNKSVKKLDYV